MQHSGLCLVKILFFSSFFTRSWWENQNLGRSPLSRRYSFFYPWPRRHSPRFYLNQERCVGIKYMFHFRFSKASRWRVDVFYRLFIALELQTLFCKYCVHTYWMFIKVRWWWLAEMKVERTFQAAGEQQRKEHLANADVACEYCSTVRKYRSNAMSQKCRFLHWMHFTNPRTNFRA